MFICPHRDRAHNDCPVHIPLVNTVLYLQYRDIVHLREQLVRHVPDKALRVRKGLHILRRYVLYDLPVADTDMVDQPRKHRSDKALQGLCRKIPAQHLLIHLNRIFEVHMDPDMLRIAHILLFPLQRLLGIKVKDRIIHQEIDDLHTLLLIAVSVTALGNLQQLFNLVKQLTMLLVNLVNPYLVLFFP